MRRNPPSTIYRYLDLSSTKRIQTHNTHRHYTTPPSQTLAQTAHPLSPNTTHTTATRTQTHIPFSPCSSRIDKAQTQHLTHVYHPYTHSPQPHLSQTPHQHFRYPRRLTTVSQQTHVQHTQQYIHHNLRNNRTHDIGYHDNLPDRPRTTTGLQTPHHLLVKVHINNTSTDYKTADTDIQQCIQHITNIPHSVLTGDCKRTLHFMALVH